MVVERPEKFSIGRVFNNIFAVIGRNIGLCLGLALLFSGVPSIVLELWNRMGAMEGIDPNAVAFKDSATTALDALITLAIVLIYFVLALLLQSALVRATIEDMNGKRPAVGDCVQIAFRYLLPTLGIGMLVALGAGIASIALLVPGIILWLGWSAAVPVLIQERLGVFGSLSRSRALTKGSRWSLFGLFLILFIAAMAVQMVLGAALFLLGGILAAIGASLVSTVFSMFLSIASAVSYVELRQVKEGTSVSELAEIFS
ncbi:hypothetical protein LGH82_08305 [Mesorhizobium sp. PAMC28654]|uniref:hypothetical protein n=1 Tax=Mesorhizobium sp. PAMC28654 TaxID=2880934 RepID=UPI001D0AB66F|nr:hypothetical protein [Mesorhizobium sp. PAMC28654]UDL92736.1 hypothetical protein LGH82_08305 [Mesorhizobium sp. PAMC28654]